MPHSKKLTAEALRYGSHSFRTANTPHLPLPVAFHQCSDSNHLITACLLLNVLALDLEGVHDVKLHHPSSSVATSN